MARSGAGLKCNRMTHLCRQLVVGNGDLTLIKIQKCLHHVVAHTPSAYALELAYECSM